MIIILRVKLLKGTHKQTKTKKEIGHRLRLAEISPKPTTYLFPAASDIIT